MISAIARRLDRIRGTGFDLYDRSPDGWAAETQQRTGSGGVPGSLLLAGGYG